MISPTDSREENCVNAAVLLFARLVVSQPSTMCQWLLRLSTHLYAASPAILFLCSTARARCKLHLSLSYSICFHLLPGFFLVLNADFNLFYPVALANARYCITADAYLLVIQFSRNYPYRQADHS